MYLIKYPLSKNMSEEDIKSKTGKSIKDINIENILSGKVSSEDIKISKDTLKMQGDFANEQGKPQMKQNFTRASELVDVPDSELLRIYDKLRPNRSTKAELSSIAKDLLEKYNATECAKLIYEAIEVYEKRGLFRV